MKTGDVVKLKSGGPLMTINNMSKGGLTTHAQCVWFKGSTLLRGEFNANLLLVTSPLGEEIAKKTIAMVRGRTR